jgi:signal peptidase I
MKEHKIIFRGASMSPFLKEGDIVFLRKSPWDKLRIGDLALIDSDCLSCPVIHRIIGWYKADGTRMGICKGDSMPQKDAFTLTKENYSGIVWARKRKGKLRNLTRLHQRMISRWIAFLSVLNLTPGILRIKTKKTLGFITPRIPGIKLFERFFLKKVQYFLFLDKTNTKRLYASLYGKTIGSIILKRDDSRLIRYPIASVFSFYSLFISSERLVRDASGKHPEVFNESFFNLIV